MKNDLYLFPPVFDFDGALIRNALHNKELRVIQDSWVEGFSIERNPVKKFEMEVWSMKTGLYLIPPGFDFDGALI